MGLCKVGTKGDRVFQALNSKLVVTKLFCSVSQIVKRINPIGIEANNANDTRSPRREAPFLVGYCRDLYTPGDTLDAIRWLADSTSRLQRVDFAETASSLPPISRMHPAWSFFLFSPSLSSYLSICYVLSTRALFSAT